MKRPNDNGKKWSKCVLIANETIICDNHTILTIQETRKEMGEGKYFSKTDFNITYHQIEFTTFPVRDYIKKTKQKNNFSRSEKTA